MKACFVRIFLLGCLFTSVIACSSLDPSRLSSLTLDEAKSGSIVEMTAGDVFVIVLEGNPTTGYTWELDTLDATIVQQIGEAEFTPESDAIGSGGKFTFRFQAISAGQSFLKLLYHRPWEQGTPPLNTFELMVIVKIQNGG
ncbi:secreted protein-like protein [Candidatus Vecturithrix granuli]|uniref:Secreted protein-like protein n=1 Tax=Vecturithrix granuli TaxID=1499967 RepID=A0A081C9Z5_VECG1|nr:secreted protein-like protein [Candidatus Vecturithrix granuli]